MTTDPDAFDFDYERSRAAVAVACLQWLRCTGPAVDFDVAREASPDVTLLQNSSTIEGLAQVSDSGYSPHPLWDRWLDG
jgi:hypothetical protein